MDFFAKLGLVIAVLLHLRVYGVAATCNRFQFQCDNEDCIPMIRLCNGRKDCTDESDESKCDSEDYPKCKSDYFQCISDKRCIPTAFACDDDEDCEDGSDEKSCHTSPCNEDRDFECVTHRECIPKEKQCDGEIDCNDRSDEQNCEKSVLSCIYGTFPCEEENRCIPLQWKCDGEHDCENGSDEKYCGIDLGTISPTVNIPGTTEQSCPDEYCEQNADCVVIRGHYHCNCPPSFTGKRCELRIAAERDFHDLGMVIGVAMTLIILFIIIGLVFFCYYKRRTSRNSTALISKVEGQMPFTSYSKE